MVYQVALNADHLQRIENYYAKNRTWLLLNNDPFFAKKGTELAAYVLAGEDGFQEVYDYASLGQYVPILAERDGRLKIYWYCL